MVYFDQTRVGDYWNNGMMNQEGLGVSQTGSWLKNTEVIKHNICSHQSQQLSFVQSYHLVLKHSRTVFSCIILFGKVCVNATQSYIIYVIAYVQIYLASVSSCLRK